MSLILDDLKVEITLDTVNEWLTHRLYHGDSAVYLCVTENGSIGVFDNLDEDATSIGSGDEAIDALFDAVRRDAPWLVDHLNDNCCLDCHGRSAE